MSASDDFKRVLKGHPMLPGSEVPKGLLGWPDPLTLKTILELIERTESLEANRLEEKDDS